MNPRVRFLLKSFGYSTFYSLVLGCAMYAFLPWDQARDRVGQLASRQLGKKVLIGSLGPWRLTGVELNDIVVVLKPTPAKGQPGSSEGENSEGKKGSPQTAKAKGATKGASKSSKQARRAPPLRIDRLAARLQLLPLFLGELRVAFVVEGLGGLIEGVVGAERSSSVRSLEIHAEGLELGRLSFLKDVVGAPLTGTVNGDSEIVFNPGKLSESSGFLELGLTQTIVGKGKIPLPAGSMFPSFDLESPTDLGVLDLRVVLGAVKRGKSSSLVATVEKFEQRGNDLSVRMGGEVSIKKKLAMSRPKLDLEIRPEKAFVERNALSMVLNNRKIQRHTKDGWIGVHLGGTVKKMRPRMQRPKAGPKKPAKRSKKGKK